MLKKTALLSLLLALSFNAAAASRDIKEYNLGVDAYRAKNYTEARRHWNKAVDQGVRDAYNNLGFLLYNGFGGDQDTVRAVALWRDAAMLGNAESQWHLASAYEEGKGTVRNQIEAYAWYECAQAAYRAESGGKQEASEITRDIDVAMPRVLEAIPEERRRLAKRLAGIYIRLYTTNQAKD